MALESIYEEIYGTGLFHCLLLLSLGANGFTFGYDLQAMIYMLVKPKQLICHHDSKSITWITKAAYEKLYTNSSYALQDDDFSTIQCFAINTAANQSVYKCNSWNYSTDGMQKTVVSENNLFCHHEFAVVLLKFLYLFFMSMGFLFCIYTDKLGRVLVYRAIICIELITDVLMVSVNNLEILFVLLPIRGFCNFLTPLGMVHLMELLPIRRRNVYGNVFYLPGSIGYVTCPLIAWWLRDWRLVKSVNLFLAPMKLLSCILFVKSPKTMLLNRDQNSAIDSLKFISKINKAKLPRDYFDALNDTNLIEKKEILPNETFIDGWKDPKMCMRLIILNFIMMVISLSYFGLTIDSHFLSDNEFLCIFLQGIVEFPSAVISIVLFNKVGRKSANSMLSLCSFSFLFISQFLPNYEMAKTAICMMAKLCLSTNLCMCQFYIIEFLPTSFRSSGLMSIRFFGSMLASSSAFINEYLTSRAALNIYAIGLLIGAIETLMFLPETSNKALPQTIADSKALIEEKQFFK